ncbi:hypothetical protein D3C73_1174240 [compost metagenome]
MRVVEARDHAAPLEVNDLGGGTAQGHGLGVGAHGNETAVGNGDSTGARVFTVNCMKLTIEQNQIGVHRVSLEGVEEDNQGANRRVARGMNR